MLSYRYKNYVFGVICIMKIRITEIVCTTNKKNGKTTEKTTAQKEYPCEMTEIKKFGHGKRTFGIDKILANSINLTVFGADAKILTVTRQNGASYKYVTPEAEFRYYFEIV